MVLDVAHFFSKRYFKDGKEGGRQPTNPSQQIRALQPFHYTPQRCSKNSKAKGASAQATGVSVKNRTDEFFCEETHSYKSHLIA
jgi:hypothetical protein